MGRMGVFILTALLALHGAPAAESATTQIYECSVNGQKVFTDRACSEDAVTRVISDSNRMEAYRTNHSGGAEKPARGAVREDAQAKLAAKKIKQCSKLRADQQLIASRMRTGYSAREGERMSERLRKRLRKINAQYYELRCDA